MCSFFQQQVSNDETSTESASLSATLTESSSVDLFDDEVEISNVNLNPQVSLVSSSFTCM